MRYVATFFTHFGAMCFHKALQDRNEESCLMPVPRQLSASCGICAAFDVAFDPDTMMNEDLEAVFCEKDGAWEKIFSAE